MQFISPNRTIIQTPKCRRTKILCSLGPTCDDEETLTQLILAGVEGARINFSHGEHKDHIVRINRFRKVEAKLGKKLPLIMDTKGPEIRVGKFEKEFDLPDGAEYTLTTKQMIGNEHMCSVTHEGLPKDVKPGDTILISEGLIELKVVKINETDIVCKAVHGGHMMNQKGINLPNIKSSLPSLTEKDLKDLKFGAENGIDIVYMSFTRSAEVIREIREHLKKCGRTDMQIIAKIENQEGLDNLDEIIEEADGVLCARGDLGTEIPVEKVPIMQKIIMEKCLKKGKVTILATHMLDSMIRNPRPTRAEVADIANAVLDKTSTLLLTGETANGKYPVDAIKFMDRIVRETELNMDYSKLSFDLGDFKEIDVKNNNTNNLRDCINYSVAINAHVTKANGIICVSNDEYTPKSLAKFRPPCPIFCATNSESVARHLSGEWGIQAFYTENKLSHGEMINKCIEKFKEMGFLEKGQIVVICGDDTCKDNDKITGIIRTIN